MSLLMEQAEELTGVGAWEKDLEKRKFLLSRGAMAIHGLERRQISEKEMDRTSPPEDLELIREAFRQAAEGDGYYQVEHRIRRLDTGELRYIQSQGVVIYDESGKAIKLYGAEQDVTERKRIESENLRLVEEKEALLKEVHHRIKNHMNTIFSILSLQAAKFDDEEVSAVFEETKSRIRLMQSIYQKLYTGDKVSSISIKHYLEELLREIRMTYHVTGAIELDSSIEDCHVSARQSLPIGIIVNELVTNAFKYAFKGRANGSIEVVVRRSGPTKLEILVIDDGEGLPGHIRQSGDYGFGLTIVDGYVRQFEGELSFPEPPKDTTGTTVCVLLELEPLSPDQQ